MATKNLAATITIGGTVTAGLKGALGSTKTALQDIGKSITELSRREKALGSAVKTFSSMGQGVEKLRREYVETIKQVENLRQAQKRLSDAQATRDRIDARAKTIKKIGVGATVAGGVLVGSMVPGVNESKHYQTEMARITALGMGDDTSKKAFAFAKEMKTFGTSQLENLELVRDGMSVFADLHHAELVAPMLAKMKFANKAMFGQERGGENAKQFMDMLKVIETRGGLSSEAAFNKQANIIQQVISATGGRVTATEWRNLISTGGLAAKGMKDEALYYTMEHLVQEQGGDKVGTGLSALYSSLYQGRTTKRAAMNLDKYGLIGDKTKVKHDKAGQVSYMDPGALRGGQVLRDNPFEWMETVLLPALAKKGVTDKDKILDVIGSVVSNKKGADILAAMYMQREQIHKSENLNRGAHNIDQLDKEARNNASGKEIEAEAKLADVKLKLGEQILPLYTSALTSATEALKSFNTFTSEHSTLSKVMVIGVTAIGAALVIAGPLLTVAAGGMTLYAAAQLRAAAAAATAANAIRLETAAIEGQNAAAAGGAGKFGKFGKFAGKALGAFAVAGIALEGAKLVGLPDVTDETQKKGEQQFRDGDYLKASANMNAGSFIKSVFTGAPKAPEAEAKPEIPPMRGVTPAYAPRITNNNEYNITQMPGESMESLARRVTELQARQNAVKARSSLTDGASAQ